ncbi:MAG: hypothetical protein HY825_13450 [Acidobacteria bacterium]|nr:hypothetical protein [Acidobacteriota bacterium]
MSSNEVSRQPRARSLTARIINRVKAILGRGRAAVKLEPERCPACRLVIEASDHWVNWPRDGRSVLWHWECLNRARGGTLLRPDPNEQALPTHVIN